MTKIEVAFKVMEHYQNWNKAQVGINEEEQELLNSRRVLILRAEEFLFEFLGAEDD